MKKAEIKAGGHYIARVSGNFVVVKVESIQEGRGWDRDTTFYNVRNLSTKRTTSFRSAAKFRREATAEEIAKTTEQYSINGLSINTIDNPMSFADNNNTNAEDEQRSDPTNTSVPNAVGETTFQTRPLEVPDCSDAENATQSTDTVNDSFAERIVQSRAKQETPTTGLTKQQQDILATAKVVEAARNNGHRVMVIGAGAGTGKTFTLKQLEQVLSGIGQYTAFNTSLVAESKCKFVRAACNTTHSLAFRAVGRRFAHRLNGQRVKSYQIANMLGIEDFLVSGIPYPVGCNEWVEVYQQQGYSDDNPPPADFAPAPTKRLKAGFLAGQVVEAIRKFCQSADDKITARHFSYIDGIDQPGEYVNNDKVRAYLLPYAERAWEDMNSETGTLPYQHDYYVKSWALGTGTNRPVIAADYILLDEAQDTAPVMLGVLQQQTHAMLVLVGDDNQQIYEWRGAVNAMASFPKAERRLLSQSFRFGQIVADVANAALAGLECPTDLVMSGLESIPSRVCEVAEPRCWLYRTNAGALGKLMSARGEGKRGHLIGGTKDVVAFCRAAVDLQNKLGTSHPQLACFGNWAEVQEYSKEDEGADLRLMVKLIDEFGAANIIEALDDMPSEADADLVLSTAHRSKGREWTSVKLGQDFPLANALSDADRRLVYVACTRAQEELDLTQCPTFCGGWDKKYGDEESQAEWVPGIEIAYTVPMPTEEELELYRAEKVAVETAKKSATIEETPFTRSQINPTLIGVSGANPAPTNGNGSTGEFTWGSVDGVWCVRGPKDQPLGQRVTVKRKNGSTSTETLKSVAKKIGDFWFYGIK